jgi:hypothetical protein
LVQRLETLAEQAGGATAKPDLVPLYEEALDYLARFGPDGTGLLLIVDELGKFLEYGAGHPEEGDVFVLQGLAEAAARAKRPFLVLTVLHQALDRYTEHVSPSRRAEWAKVQGRFEDIAFEERAEQVVRLLTRAIRPVGADSIAASLRLQGEQAADEALELGLRLGLLNESELRDCLAGSYPLHPLTVLLVGPLFRQIAQNERSLFAFLASQEPFGFQEFLRQEVAREGGCQTYRLDQLYDYVTLAVGPALFAQHHGRRWAEAQSVLDKLDTAAPLERRLAKTIGLLQLLGPAVGVPSTAQVLRFALRGPTCRDEEIDEALQGLTRRSLVVFRRQSASYVLWEGSDIDIVARLDEAHRAVGPSRGLASFLAQQASPRALVARRHYFRTGTLRYFSACYATRDKLTETLHQDVGDADGLVVYCLPLNVEDRRAMEATLRSPMENLSPGVIAALPREEAELAEWCHELACLQWVSQNTPELATDPVARREVRSRLATAETGLRSHLLALFQARPGADGGCQWFRAGEEVRLASPRELNDLLSRTCDAVYPHTPTWRNELINRRALSSAAAAARRDLIEAMIAHSVEERLGIRGAPPERSMYESLLGATGIHRCEEGVWGFYPPTSGAEPALVEVWRAIEQFLTESEGARQPVQRLFTRLARPPFGLKLGPLPVLLAASLLYHDTEVALYEEGTFVPRLDPPTVERILRAPGKFEVQRWSVLGARDAVLRRYAALLGQGAKTSSTRAPGLLDIVRPLVRFARQLPDYVGKTRQISPVAQAILRAIREARQPDRLLFVALPAACGQPSIPASGALPTEVIEAFFGGLREALGELQQAYPRLLADIEGMIVRAFPADGPFERVREKLSHEARLILNLAVDPKLKSFLIRVGDEAGDDHTWLEGLGALLGGKPPAAWDDQDRARFEVQLASSARTFHHYRALAFELEQSGAALLDGDREALRVSVTVPNGPELERVVQVPARLLPQVRQAQAEVRRVLDTADLPEGPELRMALLGQLLRELLAEERTLAVGSDAANADTTKGETVDG